MAEPLHIDVVEILRMIAESKNRTEAARAYRQAMEWFQNREDQIAVNPWPPINAAIIERWSMSGLKFVKARAWKMAQKDTR